MSRFFRSAGSSSSSSESGSASDSSDDESSAERAGNDADQALANGTALTRVNGSSSDDKHDNRRDILLHALLEEKCMTQARSSSIAQRHGPDSPEVQADAKARYQKLCAQLSPLHLVAAGLEHDDHAMTRQQFRNGLELLSQNEAAKTAVPGSLRKLLTIAGPVSSHPQSSPSAYTGAVQKSLTNSDAAVIFPKQQPLPFFAPALGPLNNTGQLSYQTQAFESRYHREFEELGTLGRGGFGVVYHVRHRLDKQAYAVKKVPLSRSRIQKITHHGQSELDEFLLELKTLARLEHPNIVRYYNGWIEWTDSSSTRQCLSSDGGLSSDNAHGPPAGTMGQPEPSFSQFMPNNRGEEVGVVFENTEPLLSSSISSGADDISTRGRLALRAVSSRGTVATVGDDSVEHLHPVSTRGTVATTVSDDAVETIERSEDPSVSMFSDAEGQDFTEPTLALHVQMSLHPMTLTDFLSPPSLPAPHAAQALSHCFHVSPTASILLAVLDGIDYLHSEGIVHRDIKPANIFLGASVSKRVARGSVDLAHCPDCESEGNITPGAINVRIGDFGLVTALAQDTKVGGSPAIGTALYRPLTPISDASPGLDFYALGIIAFELLHRFGTRMERYEAIQSLKQGEYPRSFNGRVGAVRATQARECIDAMLSRDGATMKTRELRRKLSALQNSIE